MSPPVWAPLASHHPFVGYSMSWDSASSLTLGRREAGTVSPYPEEALV